MPFRVSEFVSSVQQDMNGLIDYLSQVSGRSTPAEREAWQRSLPRLSTVLEEAQSGSPVVASLHISLSHLLLEYRLPSASAWCDVVLLGKSPDNQASVLVIELKDWDTSTDSAGESEGLITHKGIQYGHPSDQVKGYTLYCQRFHSTVEDYQAQVKGCVYFTHPGDITPYYQPPNTTLAAEYPLFTTSSTQYTTSLPDYIAAHISDPYEAFAVDFDKGYYRQNRNILMQVTESLKQRELEIRTPFELLDEQRKGFNLVMGLVRRVYQVHDQEKHVIIVEGPPGSGKSALAANLWIECVLTFIQGQLLKADPTTTRITDNVVFVTTSSSQKANWKKTFESVGRKQEAKHFVLSSNEYNPGITGQMVSRLRSEGHTMAVQDWQDNLSILKANGVPVRSPDNHHFISIVDEAHALINTEGHRIGFASGWVQQAGPQAYHVIRASQISIFFTDGKQSYRDNETTTVNNLRDFAARQGAHLHEISLEGHQFRCGGSREYVQFVEDLFVNTAAATLDTSWCRTPSNPDAPFVWQLVNYPHQLDELLNTHMQKGATGRLISSYSREWVTKAALKPHSLPDQDKDFHEPYTVDGVPFSYAKSWNFAPGEDYTLFVQAPKGSAMYEDPLCEVGCPYVVRGFDYDYVGLLWLEDLVWRTDRWVVQADYVKETAFSSTSAAARNARQARLKTKQTDLSPEETQLLDKVVKGYRILLTRALKGVYLWVKDDETRAYLKQLVDRPS